MPEPHRGRTRPWATPRPALIVLTACLLLGTTGTTGAGWTGASLVPGTTVHAGRVDLRLNGQDSVTGYSAMDATGLAPGGSTAGVLTVANAGSVPLGYTVATRGSNTDGKGLFAGLQRRITDATTVTAASTGSTCGGTVVTGTRSLAAGASEKVCVELALPATAPASLAGARTDVTISVDGSNHAWTDRVDASGTRLGTVALTAPVLACGAGLLGSITLTWSSVPGATGYRVQSGALGGTVEDVSAGTLSKTLVGQGIASVQAIFGSTSWLSLASNTLSYSALTGVLGSCS